MDVFWSVFGLAVVIFLVYAATQSVFVIPHMRARNLERFGVYKKTLGEGLHLVIPFADKLRATIDLREQWLAIEEQVITADNVGLGVNTVVYFQVTEPKQADYEVADYVRGIEKLAGNMLRDVVGKTGLQTALTLTSREMISGKLVNGLNAVTRGWGIKVRRVKLVTLDPPQAIQEAMESRQATILRAQGQAEAIRQVSEAIHKGAPNADLLAYQYLQMLPELTQGDGSTVVLLPSELTNAIRSVGSAFGGPPPIVLRGGPAGRSGNGPEPGRPEPGRPESGRPEPVGSEPDSEAQSEQGAEGEQQAAGAA
jgi:regulator of protease activity HflC (stomatin/prohibitin superfamily)